MDGTEPFWTALGSEPGKLLAGFLLTTVLGGLLTYVFQELSWKRQARLDLYHQRYKEGTEFLERLSSLIDRRYYSLQRLIWVIEDSAGPEKLALREREYFETVIEWNQNLRSTHNRIRILIGEREALEFLDYGDDFRPENPQSLHYRFVKAHRAVLAAKADPALVAAAKQEVDRLNWKLSRFLYDVTTLFTQRAGSLNLLQLPDTPDLARPGHVSGPPVVGEDGTRLRNAPPDPELAPARGRALLQRLLGMVRSVPRV